MALPRMFDAGDSERHLADVPAHLLLVGARQGRPGKVVAELMGHAKVDTTLNVYTQVLDDAKRAAAQKIGNEFAHRIGRAR